MPRNTGRAVRLIQIQHFVRRNPLGLTTRELAKLCDVHIRTVQRDLLTLQSDLQVPYVNRGYDRYGLPEGYLLSPISLSLYEAVGLFLAARLVIRQTDEYNSHIESALSRLSSIMPPSVAKHLEQGIRRLSSKPPSPEYLKVFEQIALAWSTQRRTEFKYRSLQSNETKLWVIDPYFIEMTGTGYST